MITQTFNEGCEFQTKKNLLDHEEPAPSSSKQLTKEGIAHYFSTDDSSNSEGVTIQDDASGAAQIISKLKDVFKRRKKKGNILKISSSESSTEEDFREKQKTKKSKKTKPESSDSSSPPRPKQAQMQEAQAGPSTRTRSKAKVNNQMQSPQPGPSTGAILKVKKKADEATVRTESEKLKKKSDKEPKILPLGEMKKKLKVYKDLNC